MKRMEKPSSMNSFRFLISGTLLFVAIGPLVASLGFIASARINLIDDPFPLLSVTSLSYLVGLPYTLLHGGVYCLALLGTTAALPGLAREDHPLTRSALAIAVGLVVVSLLQVLPFLPPLLRGVTTVSEAWRALDLAMVNAIYLTPTLVCAGFIGWKLLPRLQRHCDELATHSQQDTRN